jgi:predicted transcriptional regulator YdeE
MGLTILDLLNRAYSEWLPSSGYEKSPILDNMEIYYTDIDGKYFEEVWIPVKKAS